jgi:hypothetical protein
VHRRALLGQQGEHHKRTEVAVENHHVVGLKASQQFAEQGRFPGLFAGVGAQGQIVDSARGQRQDHAGPRDGKAHARGLGRGLWKGLLVLRRVGHGEGEAIDQLGMSAVPEPVRRRRRFQLPGRLADQLLQRPGVQLGARPAIVAGVTTRHRGANLLPVGGDVGHRLGARGTLAVAQHLGQERPQHQRRRKNVRLSEPCVPRGERLFDVRGG